MRFVHVAMLCGAAMLPGAARAGLVFDSMGVDAESYVVAHDFDYSNDKYKSDFTLAFKASRSANTSASLNKTGATGSAASKVTGTFASKLQGSLQFSPQTSSMTVTDPGMTEAFAYATASFQYNFQLTTDMYLTYDHSISTSGTQVDGTAFGQFFHIDMDYGASTVFSEDWMSGEHSGTIHLVPGNYSMWLQSDQLNWSDFVGGMTGSNQTSLTSSFDYAFSDSAPPAPVPEPATLGLLVIGVTALARSRRRR